MTDGDTPIMAKPPTTRPTESEFKLRAERAVEVAAVDAALRELGAECREQGTHRHLDVYLDDDRGSLASAGVGLRLRSGPTGARLTCKLRGPGKNGLFVRTELEANWPSTTLPGHAADLGDELRDAVQPFVLDRPLSGRQELDVRREVRVLTQSGHDLCELAIDFVEARANGRTATFQEIELEVLDDLAGNERLANGLRERLPLAFSERDKPSHAASLLGVERANGAARAESPNTPIGRAILDRLLTRLMTMRRHEVGVREDDDPEHLHQMRVSIRRMRSLLRAFRELWPGDVATRLQAHLGETGRQLGTVRDLDVMLEQLPDDVEELPPQLHGAGQRTIEWVRHQRDRAHRRVQDWLRDDTRLANAARLDADLHAIDLDADAARRPLAEAGPARLGEAVANLRRKITEIPPDLPSGPTHRLRLQAKRVRYLGEELVELPGADYDKSLRFVTRVQQRLGDVCDHELASERLLSWVHAAASESPDGAWTAAALGGLAANRSLAAEVARDDADRALQRLDRKKVWRRFPTPLR